MDERMQYSVATALPVAFATASYALFSLAHIRAGQKVLVRSGAGGFGQACIQFAHTVQAELFTTAGTSAKRDFLAREYRIPDDHIYSSRDSSFKESILEVTNGYGIDVVVNSLAGELLRSSWELIAANGVFIEVGKKDIYNPGSLPMWPFHRGATFSSVDLAKIYQDTPEVIGALLKHIINCHTDGRIFIPKPLEIFKSTEIGSAFRKLQSGKSQGKIVVEFETYHIVPVRLFLLLHKGIR